MADNTDVMIERIKSDPQFKELVRKRSAFAWFLSFLMVAIYFGFVLTVAFHKEWLGQPLLAAAAAPDGTPVSSSVTTVGIPIGLGVIASAFILTGIYVARANSAFDELTKKIIEKVKN